MARTHETTLHYLGGTSDKIYKAWIETYQEDFVVNFAFGRRGSTLQVGTKTQNSVTKPAAIRVYEKLVKSKLDKGYQIIGCLEDKESSIEKPTAVYRSIIEKSKKEPKRENLPQLLNPINQEQIESLINDSKWVFQEKLDGKRMLIEVKNTKAKAFNRKGQEVGAPESILQEAETLAQGKSLVLDGEAIGEEIHVFDILNYEKDLKELPYKERLKTLEKLSGRFFGMHIKFVQTHKSKEKKKEVFESLQLSKAEGIVAKQLEAKYTPGRPNSGGDQLKYKFVKTASVIVEGHNQKHSVSLCVLEGKKKIQVGNVTIPQKEKVPSIDSIIEVKYLYAMPNSNSLYQPVYLGVREDIDKEECCIEQLEYKK